MPWNSVVISRIGPAYGARGSASSIVIGAPAEPMGTRPVRKRTVMDRVKSAKPRERAK